MALADLWISSAVTLSSSRGCNCQTRIVYRFMAPPFSSLVILADRRRHGPLTAHLTRLRTACGTWIGDVKGQAHRNMRDPLFSSSSNSSMSPPSPPPSKSKATRPEPAAVLGLELDSRRGACLQAPSCPAACVQLSWSWRDSRCGQCVAVPLQLGADQCLTSKRLDFWGSRVQPASWKLFLSLILWGGGMKIPRG